MVAVTTVVPVVGCLSCVVAGLGVVPGPPVVAAVEPDPVVVVASVPVASVVVGMAPVVVAVFVVPVLVTVG